MNTYAEAFIKWVNTHENGTAGYAGEWGETASELDQYIRDSCLDSGEVCEEYWQDNLESMEDIQNSAVGWGIDIDPERHYEPCHMSVVYDNYSLQEAKAEYQSVEQLTERYR
jgi:hypothetical protein